MSDERTRKGGGDGSWRAQKSSASNKFQDDYMTLDEHSSLWLEDKGWNESLKEFRVHCKLCNKDMQCRKETIKSHPNGDSHKKHLARALEKHFITLG